MRVVLAMIVLAAFGGTFLPAHGEQPAPTLAPVDHYAGVADRQLYVVKCRVKGDHDSPYETVSAPKLMVAEGMVATITSQTQSPFVTGIRETVDGEVQPIVTVLDAGYEIKVKLTSLLGDGVQLDATVKRTMVSAEDVIPSPCDENEVLQAPQTSSCEIRTVKAVQPGELVKLACGWGCCNNKAMTVELTIDHVDPAAASITPIAATEPKCAPACESGPFYTVVYAVGDLLEPHCRAKQSDELETADFVPIIDTVLREALVDWSEDAAIRPFPKNKSLVVSQTQQGHEVIAQLLRDKRDRVADVQKLLRR